MNCSRIISRTMIQLEASNRNVDNFISASVDMEGELAEAEANVRALDVEFRTMSSIEKRNTQQKVNGYKEELKNLQQQYATCRSQIESSMLKGGVTATGDRSKLVSANERLDQSTAILENSRQIIAETENIGTSIISDMESQKEKLGSAKQNVQDTHSITEKAKGILRSMYSRAVSHKVGVAVTMVLLFGAIVGVGYEAFIAN